MVGEQIIHAQTDADADAWVEKTVNELKAFLENEPVTRTTLSLQNDGIYKTYWDKEDSLGVIIDDDPTIYPYELTEGGESSSATFKGNAIGDHYEAFYPYNMIKDYRNGSFEIEMPSEQSYIKDSFAPNSFPMIAQSSTSTLLFKNLASVLKISVRGKYYIKNIIVEANDASLKLSGAAVVQNDSLKMSDSGSNKVILKDINLTLDPYQTTDFYIVLPPENYKGGLTLTFSTNSGYIRKIASSDILLERSQVRTTKLNLTALTEGDEPVSRLKGNGTKSSPYLIGNVAELIKIGDYAFEDAYFKLTSDISLKFSCGGDFGNWEPIQYFHGYFDGDNHRITDLYSSSMESLWGVGLFGYVYGGISNLNVSGIIDVPNSSNVGLICGMSWGAFFKNCSVDGQVSGWSQVGGLIGGDSGGYDCPGTKVEDCTNNATVMGYDGVGGIVGGSSLYYEIYQWYSDPSQIKDCINYGSIMNNGNSLRLGGIYGDAEHSIDILNCANFGKIDALDGVAGGMTGYLSEVSNVYNCYNHGEVINTKHFAGGIVGYSFGTVSNCYNVGYVKAVDISKEGGISGFDNGISKHNYWLYDESLAIGNLSGIGYFTSPDTDRDCKPMTKSQMLSDALLNELNSWTEAHESKGYAKWKFIEDGTYPALEYEKEAHHTDDHVMDFFTFADESSCTVEPEGGIIEVKFITNMEVKVSSLPDWIEEVEQANTKAVEKKSLYFRCKANNRSSKRDGRIIFNDSKGNQLEYYVLQYEPGYYVSTDFSRDGEVRVLQKATKGKGIDIVIMGDIFTDRDIANVLYDDYVNRTVEAIFSKEPYRSFREFFNVYEVYAVSQDENYDYVNGGKSALGCYWAGGTNLGGSTSAVVDYTQRVIPDEKMDEALTIVIMNFSIYAGTCHMYSAPYANDYGSGYAIAYCAVGDDVDTFVDIVRHEAGGHGFAKLADEYDGNGPIGEAPIMKARSAYSSFGWYKNIDFTSDPGEVIWSHFIKEHDYENEKIGVFEGGYTYDSGVFRPTENSIMRYNQGEYNAPSREAIYYRIHKLAFDNYKYSFDEFKNYDRVNARQSSAATKSAGVTRQIPLAEPVVKDYEELKRILNAK